MFARTSRTLRVSPHDDDNDGKDGDEVEDNDKDNNNNKDNNNDKGISALGLDKDLGFSEGHQWHQPHDDDDYDHHHEANPLDVLAKTVGLYLVPQLR